jgi:hypothetical protein
MYNTAQAVHITYIPPLSADRTTPVHLRSILITPFNARRQDSNKVSHVYKYIARTFADTQVPQP